MKINLAKSAGFCSGVRRAIKIAFDTIKDNKKVYMLGDIVHNEYVCKQISDAGIKKVKRLIKSKDRTLLIRAHGMAQKIFQKAAQFGYKIVDATCPMVKEIHKIAIEAEKEGYAIVVIGDKKHSEVRGIVGQLTKKAIIIDNIDNIPLEKIKKMVKVAVVVQSTQNMEKVLEIVERLKEQIRDLKFFNTICRPTKTKQQEIKAMSLENDIMIIIGSKTSANTRRLYEISKSLNKRSYWIHSKEDIKSEWLRNAGNVGVTSGASTPDFITKDIVEYIKKITN